jgi:hypothetical protein
MQPLITGYRCAVLLCALIAFAVNAGRAAQADPLVGDDPASKPAGPSTWHDYRDGMIAFNQRTLSVAYKSVGKHGPWDADAVKFLDDMAVRFSAGNLNWVYHPKGGVKSLEELAAAGKALVDAGCTDPLVGYCYGFALHESGKPAEALPYVQAAAEGLEPAGYPSSRIAGAAARLMKLDPSTAEGMRPVVEMHRLKTCCGKLDDTARRQAAEHTSSDLTAAGRAAQVAFTDKLREMPDADPWVLNVLDGRLHIKLAWDSRGGGWANTVTDEGWRGFFDHLAKARDSLTAAYKLAPHLPEASIEMITVSMGAGEKLGEDQNTWFDRATAAQLDHDHAYATMLNALLPRWGGTYAQMFDLGRRGVMTGRYDTIAPWQFVRAVQRIVNDSGGNWPAVLARPGVYEGLVEVANKYAAYSVKVGHPEGWFLTFRAALAWRADKYAEARKLLDKAGEGIDPTAFLEFGSQNPPAAIGHVYAMSGPQAAAVEEAEASLEAERYEDALKSFRAVAAAADNPERMKPYLEARIELVDRKAKFARGDWVEVQPDQTLKGWRAVSGAWEVDKDGVLVGRNAGKYMPAIVFSEPLGPRFEVACRMEPGTPTSQPGVALARGEHPVYYVSFGGGHVSLFDATGKDRQRVPAEALNKISGPAEVVVRYDNGKLSATVAGKSVLENHPAPPPHALGDVRIAVHMYGNGTARYGGLKVRKFTDDAVRGNPRRDGLE